MVYVYSTSTCAPCKMVKGELEKKGLLEGVDWESKDIEANETYKKELEEMGYQSVPVVTREDEVLFQGFRPDIIQSVF